MSRQLSFTIYSVFIILTLSNVIVLADECADDPLATRILHTLGHGVALVHSYSCGTFDDQCPGDSPSSGQSSNISLPVLISAICSLFCCCIAIIKCCSIRNQRTQPVRRVTRVVPARQRAPIVTNINPGIYGSTTTQIHNICEELPPAYDSIIKDGQYQLPTELPPPKYETNEEVNLRV